MTINEHNKLDFQNEQDMYMSSKNNEGNDYWHAEGNKLQKGGGIFKNIKSILVIVMKQVHISREAPIYLRVLEVANSIPYC